MPEEETPWDFLVNAPERRRYSRSEETDCSHGVCERLIGVENRVAVLADAFHTHKRDATSERNEILQKLDKIDSHLDRQKGFFAGVVWLGAAIATITGSLIAYLKH